VKILLTVHQFFPDFFAGTEVLTLSVAKELKRRGHQVVVLTGYPVKHLLPAWQRFDCYDLEGVEVHRFAHSFTPMGDQCVLSEIEYDNHLVTGFFAHLLDTVRPDIVHFFHFSRLGSGMVDSARHKAVPAYYTPTDFWAICPTIQLLLANGNVCPGPTAHGGNCIKHVATLTQWRNRAALVKYLPDRLVEVIAAVADSDLRMPFPFRQELAALSRRSACNVARLNGLHAIFSPTRLMTDVLTRNGVDARLIVQSAYGLDISGFGEVQRAFDPARPLTFGYIGTLIPHKGCEVLIKAFLRLNHREARLHIYGDLTQFPEYVARLQALAAGRDDIVFLGTFPNDQIAEVLARIDAVAVPSLWYENTPLVVYSALASKCPVIASDFPGMSEAVHDGYNGLTFEPGNVDALAHCLRRLSSTPALLRELSAHCDQPKSIATYVDELLAVYADPDRRPLHDLPDRPPVQSYRPEPPRGRIVGWAAVACAEPRSLRLVVDGREVGRTTQLLPRPDVRDRFRRSGRFVRGVQYGFDLTLNAHVSPEAAILIVEDRHGALQEIPFRALTVGRSVKAADNLLIGIDAAEFDLSAP